MSRVRVHNFSVSLDGFGTGEGQSLEAPFGHAGTRLHEWFFPTRTLPRDAGRARGEHRHRRRLRQQLGPGHRRGDHGTQQVRPPRGPWADEDWKGWWGDDPPFHTPVFVLTHHPRPSIEMKGGTTFHFIDASPDEALEAAREAAGGLDVRIGGGPVDHPPVPRRRPDRPHALVIVPIVLGRGERLWDGLEGLEERFDVESASSPSGVTHVTFTRR